jgi:aminoglycoside 3-N-acetyltransferase
VDRAVAVNRLDIVSGLARLGVVSGDVLFVHSSLRAFGFVEGGEAVVADALIESVGPDGSVVVPTFGDYFQAETNVWDPVNTPSRMGRISEHIRTMPNALRSLHAIHPVSAIGAKAREVIGGDHETDFDQDSPFDKLITWGARILLLGVGWNVCTMFHVMEERVELPYRRWIERSGQRIIEGAPQDRVYRFLARYPGVRNDFVPFGERLEALGLVTKAKIGDAICRAIRADDLHREAMAAVETEPLVLVSKDTREEAMKYC